MIVVSHRGPVSFQRSDDGSFTARRGAGGVVSALAPLLRNREDATWIAAAIGDDDLGRLVEAKLGERGVATGALQRSARPTGLSVHLLRGGDRAILTSAGAIADLDVGAACAAIVRGVRHVHLSSVYLVPPLLADGRRVLDAARAAGTTVSVDTNYDPSEAFAAPDWLRAADVILPNAAEARALTGREDVAAAARDLAAEGATVAVKLGADGALAVAGPAGDVVRAAAPPAPPIVDAVGAGDAFDAGFLRGHLDGRPLADCLALACAAGTLSLRDRGDGGHATLDEALALAGPAP